MYVIAWYIDGNRRCEIVPASILDRTIENARGELLRHYGHNGHEIKVYRGAEYEDSTYS